MRAALEQIERITTTLEIPDTADGDHERLRRIKIVVAKALLAADGVVEVVE